MSRATATRHWVLLLLLSATGSISCSAFLESAFELTFGPGDIERIAFDARFPSVDEMGGLDDEELKELPGYPETLTDGTMAHLQGALTLQGECQKTVVLEEEEADERVSAQRTFSLTTCTGEPRCAPSCVGDLYGMRIDMRVPFELIDETKAAEVKDMLADVSPDSIVQVRLRFFEMSIFHDRTKAGEDGTPGERLDMTSLFSKLSLRLENPEGEAVTLLEPGHLPSISAETPQRFDIDSNSDFMDRIKEDLLDAQPITVAVVISMDVTQANLYEIFIDEAGIAVDIQPEFVVSVVEAAKSSL